MDNTKRFYHISTTRVVRFISKMRQSLTTPEIGIFYV